ncbi:hypothetical protein ACQ5SO_03540 [Rhodovulum sp. DZ06]|uniref:hypothetical protein n=1 Tax=Rhodovulum sp. DZ06 TaxID=3425126 RepID=UPI003D3473FA
MRGRRMFLLGAAAAALGACRAATPEQQVAALSPSAGAVDMRRLQTRRFDTADQALMMQSAVGALQDLGFTIQETDMATGVLVANKARGGELRAQVTVRRLPDDMGTAMRATFQKVLHRPGAMLPVGRTLDDPALYQGFFERVSQSAYLTANDI